MSAINRAYYEVLQRFGVTADYAWGQGCGELCALCAAGVYDADSLNRLSVLRGQLVARGDGGRGSAETAFKEGLAKVELRRARFPVIANQSADRYPNSSQECREVLASQLISEVNWARQVAFLHAQGARIFVEVGPQQVLSKLLGEVLADRPHKTVAMDASYGKSGLLDLARSLANLASLGLPVRLAGWELPPAPGRRKAVPAPSPGTPAALLSALGWSRCGRLPPLDDLLPGRSARGDRG